MQKSSITQNKPFFVKHTKKLPFLIFRILAFFIVIVSISFLIRTSQNSQQSTESKNIKINLNTPQGRDTQRLKDLAFIKGNLLYNALYTRSFPTLLSDLQHGAIKKSQDIPTDPLSHQNYMYHATNENHDFQLCTNFETRRMQCFSSSQDELNNIP